jgi:hypothetical protein
MRNTGKSRTIVKTGTKRKIDFDSLPNTYDDKRNLNELRRRLLPKVQSKTVKVEDAKGNIKTEKQVKESCINYLKKQGWEITTIYTGGVPTSSGLIPNPAKGIPDCIATHKEFEKLIWIEWKKSHGGKLSEFQINFHERLKICKQLVFVVNSLNSLKQQLLNHLLIEE